MLKHYSPFASNLPTVLQRNIPEVGDLYRSPQGYILQVVEHRRNIIQPNEYVYQFMAGPDTKGLYHLAPTRYFVGEEDIIKNIEKGRLTRV